MMSPLTELADYSLIETKNNIRESVDFSSQNGYGWAGSFPAPCGLYDPEQERDSCGVGFIVNIKGQRSHSILHDASFILCNMTHRKFAYV